MLEWFNTPLFFLGHAFEEAFAGSYTYAILTVFWTLFSNLWYFMLLGPAVGVVIARLVSDPQARSAIEGRGMWGAALAALSRPLVSEELSILRQLHAEEVAWFGQRADEAIRVVGGFPAPDTPTHHTAAWIGVARTLLNLDEFLTRD